MKQCKKIIKIIVLVSTIFMLGSIYTPQAKPRAVLIGAVVSYAYSVQMITVPGYVGETGMAKAFFKPAEGYKWNKGYPAFFEIMPADFTIAAPIKEEIHFEDGTLCVPYSAKDVGRIQIEGLVNFSICNEKECIVFRNEKITLSLIVTQK
jgi:hypothetical protein